MGDHREGFDEFRDWCQSRGGDPGRLRDVGMWDTKMSCEFERGQSYTLTYNSNHGEFRMGNERFGTVRGEDVWKDDEMLRFSGGRKSIGTGSMDRDVGFWIEEKI